MNEFKILVLILFLFITCSNLYPQWQFDGVAVCDTTGQQAVGGIVSDGQSGAFIVWGDSRGNDWNIYAQHVGSGGNFYWEEQGKSIIQFSGLQTGPRAISDGEGGFILAWHDSRNGSTDIYAQRVNAAGQQLWEFNGLPVVMDPEHQSDFRLTGTNDGKFVFSWADDRADSSGIYAQKISPNGDILWNTNGKRASSWYGFPEITPDRQGGCVLAWASFDGSLQLYAQHLDGKGNRLWGNNGVVASTNFAHWSNSDISICSDSANGAIIAWHYTQNNNAYIQRVDSSGNRLWGNTGIQIGNVGPQQRYPKVALLNGNRVLCIWRDFNLYIQKYDLEGISFFPLPGIQINSYIAGIELDVLINNQKEILITNTKTVSSQPYDTVHVYAHKVDSSGQILWDSSGAAICRKPFDPFDIVRPLLTTDTEGGAIITWIDYRKHSTDVDCYAQRVYADGRVGGDTITSIVTENIDIPEKWMHIDSAYPNPFNNQLTLSFTLAQPRMLEIDIYNIRGQKIKTLANRRFPGGKHLMNWDGQNQHGKEVSSGIYFIVIQSQGNKFTGTVLLVK